ncbi:DUF1987 domain-containing protein [Ekhidna sp.]|uniref:DUF1987 domain-containing protein n=1 Tax=Ekhidna sp. TaxID=2608089 RepID=UPI003B59114C
MKKPYITEATRTTPMTCVDYKTGRVMVKGRSSPENTMEFYDPFLAAISELGESDHRDIKASFKLIYFNTSSARCIYLIVKELKMLMEKGKNLTINWYAEEDDEDMIDTAMDFQDIIGIEFNIKIFSSSESLK